MDTDILKNYGTLLAIVLATGLIAWALTFNDSGNASSNGGAVAGTPTEKAGMPQPSGKFRAPSTKDHVFGNPGAAIAMVEYSDLECPFCARVHPTLARVVEENEDVKWIYRHLPLSTIHSNAFEAAVASECIAKLAGNEAFWQFLDRALMEQHNLGGDWYRLQATTFGISASAFDSCMLDESVSDEVHADLAEAAGIGGRGTPYVVIVTPKGKLLPFSGALPYEQVIALINQARTN